MTSKHLVFIHGTYGRGEHFADARSSFEALGYTVHTPTLRHHELPLDEGKDLIAPLSLLDFTADLVTFVETLDSPPVVIGHSLGGLLAELVAARTPVAGLVAATPAPAAGIFAFYPGPVACFAPHFLQPRPWAKPLLPDLAKFKKWTANEHSAEWVDKFFPGFGAEAGRAYCEMSFWQLDRRRAARVDFDAVTVPVLAIGGENDKLINKSIPKATAKKFAAGTYAEIPGSDHMIWWEEPLPVVVQIIEDWIAANRIFAD